jgi:hypothetical protein
MDGEEEKSRPDSHFATGTFHIGPLTTVNRWRNATSYGLRRSEWFPGSRPNRR